MAPLRHAPIALLLAAALTLGSGYPSTPNQVAVPRSAVRGAAQPPAQATIEGPTDPIDPKATPDDGKATPTPPPEVVKLDIDQALTDHLAKLLAFESDYIKSHDSFFQALDSHTKPPEDGAAVVADSLADGPSNQTEKDAYLWQQLQLDAALPYSSRVDVYDGPEGKGYVLTVSVVLEKVLWERVVNTGPEVYREQPWHVVEPERVP